MYSTPKWQALRPGDPLSAFWIPLWINLERDSKSYSIDQITPEAMEEFTELELQKLKSEYSLFWLVQGFNALQKPQNIYDALSKHGVAKRFLIHATPSRLFQLEESTYVMPHGLNGELLAMKYERLVSETVDLSLWKGRYSGPMGQLSKGVPDAKERGDLRI